jgi:hypothetical protein
MSATKRWTRRLGRVFLTNSLVQIPVFAALLSVASVAAMNAYGGIRSDSHSMAPCFKGATATPAGTPSRGAEAALNPSRILLPIAAHLPSIGILEVVHVRN